MKKVICLICSMFILVSIFNVSALAYDNESVQIIETAEGLYNTTNVNTRATGLISQKTLSLSKTSDGRLLIVAQTFGSTEVTKCGFTYIKLQRLVSGSWSDYSTYCYEDMYSESNSYGFSKYITPASGYTYRVIAEHYAEKPFLGIFTSDETSYNETSSLSF